MAWTIHRESAVFVGGGAAALLQLAHPYVAHGVDQHSATRVDMLGRFRRTFAQVFAMSFGDLDRAFEAARRVHAIHTRITGPITEDAGAFARGHTYHANDAHALLWVHATLVHTAVQVFELLVRPLGAHERERYYQESKLFAYLFGIPDALVPADWPALASYMRRMVASDTLHVGAPARALCGFLLEPPNAAVAPLWRWYGLMTRGLLPPRLRRDYGLSMSAAQRSLFAASVRAVGPLYWALPASLRHVPGYVQGRRRVAGLAPSRVSAALERLLLHGAPRGRRRARGR